MIRIAVLAACLLAGCTTMSPEAQERARQSDAEQDIREEIERMRDRQEGLQADRDE